MKKFLIIVSLLFFQFSSVISAQTFSNYSKIPYIGTEINKAVNGDIPFVLVIANPDDRTSIIKYFPIGKMVYKEFQNKYDFCILNANIEDNKEYINFFNPQNLPEVYIVNPKQNNYGRIDKKYHNTSDMRRILNNILNSAKE